MGCSVALAIEMWSIWGGKMGMGREPDNPTGSYLLLSARGWVQPGVRCCLEGVKQGDAPGAGC